MRKGKTEAEIDAEIAALQNDEDVKAYKRAQAKRQYLYALRWMKKKGQELRQEL